MTQLGDGGEKISTWTTTDTGENTMQHGAQMCLSPGENNRVLRVGKEIYGQLRSHSGREVLSHLWEKKKSEIVRKKGGFLQKVGVT